MLKDNDLYAKCEAWNTIWERPYKNYEKHHELFWSLIRKKARGNVLDLGCGSGSCWRGYTSDFEIVGVDFSFRACFEFGDNVTCKHEAYVGDVANFKLLEDDPRKFDTIVLCGVINYYRNLSGIKRTISDNIAPGGQLLMTINVIKDFPDRTWSEDLIKKEFGEFGVVTTEFYDKIGYLITVSCF